MDKPENGHNPTEKALGISEKWTAVLTYDTHTHNLDIGGRVPTLDVYLFLLDMAHRKVEAEQKAADLTAKLAGPRAALPGELQALLNRKG